MTDFDKHIKEQLGRLRHLNGYPTEAIALRDYAAAMQVAQTREGVTRVMDSLMQELLTRDCPTAAVIRGKAWADREAQERPQQIIPRVHCPACQDFGVIESTHVDDFNSVAGWCDCRSGQDAKRRGHRNGFHGCHDGGSPCIDCVNQARAKLRRIFKTNPLAEIARKGKQVRNPEEIYHGQF